MHGSNNTKFTYKVKVDTLPGKHLATVPRNIKIPVKIIAFRRPLASKNHKTGTTGMMYIILPQFPKRASVEAFHSGHKIANKEVEIGPKEFQIIPWNENAE